MMVRAYKIKDYFDAFLSIRHFILRPFTAFRIYCDVKRKKTKFPCIDLNDDFWDIFEDSLAVRLIAVDCVYNMMLECGWDGKTWE